MEKQQDLQKVLATMNLSGGGQSGQMLSKEHVSQRQLTHPVCSLQGMHKKELGDMLHDNLAVKQTDIPKDRKTNHINESQSSLVVNREAYNLERQSDDLPKAKQYQQVASNKSLYLPRKELNPQATSPGTRKKRKAPPPPKAEQEIDEAFYSQSFDTLLHIFKRLVHFLSVEPTQSISHW
jgi:hypothetical protein